MDTESRHGPVTDSRGSGLLHSPGCCQGPSARLFWDHNQTQPKPAAPTAGHQLIGHVCQQMRPTSSLHRPGLQNHGHRSAKDRHCQTAAIHNVRTGHKWTPALKLLEELEPSHTAGGTGDQAIPLLGVMYPKGLKTHIYTKACRRMLTAVLFLIVTY